ncbi:MAG: hypothetical protein CMM47_02080 [Rhodospirillaceae bacterium]|nr:hypothetical protein [Rhodospirillaceae bacterium]
MKKSYSNRQSRRQMGLTLIELVMVLVVLTALAAMVVPIIDNVRRTSDKATASAVMKQLLENISLYRTTKGIYPSNFDSLLDDADQSVASSLAKSGKGISHALTANEATSLTAIGIKQVQDLDVDNSLGLTYRNRPGNSGVSPRTLATGQQVYVVTDGNIVRSVYPLEGSVAAANAGDYGLHSATGTITKANGIRVKLVVFGVGPRSDLVGQTMMSPPAYSGVTAADTKYNRFLAIFAAYDGGVTTSKRRAQLKGAMDSTFDFLNQEINEVEENTIE